MEHEEMHASRSVRKAYRVKKNKKNVDNKNKKTQNGAET